jgi:hypothetical protein
LSGGAYIATVGSLGVHGYINADEREGWLIQLSSGVDGDVTYTTSVEEEPAPGFTSSRSFRQLLRKR